MKYVHFMWWPMYILRDDLCTFCEMTYVHFAWWHMYILRDDLCIFYVMANVHFTWWPMYILRDDLCTFHAMTSMHFPWWPMNILRHVLCTFFVTISHSVLLRMRNVFGRSSTDNQNKYFIFSNILPRAVAFESYCAQILRSQTGNRWHCNMAQ